MLNYEAHSRFAEATAAMMQSCAAAAAQTMTASANQTLSLWSAVLCPSAEPDAKSRPARTRSTRNWYSTPTSPFDFWQTYSANLMSPYQMNWWNWAQPSWPGWGGNTWMPAAFANPWMQPMSSLSWQPWSAWTSWSRAGAFVSFPGWNPSAWNTTQRTTLQDVALPKAKPPYASYRSSGGHASAQVIMDPMTTAVAGLAATAVLSQMQTVMDVWRSMMTGV